MEALGEVQVEALMLPGALGSLLRRPPWQADAACRDHSLATFFKGPGASVAAARAVCARCPVKEPCLAYALEFGGLTGIWGGTTAHERSQLRRSRRASA